MQEVISPLLRKFLLQEMMTEKNNYFFLQTVRVKCKKKWKRCL